MKFQHIAIPPVDMSAFNIFRNPIGHSIRRILINLLAEHHVCTTLPVLRKMRNARPTS